MTATAPRSALGLTIDTLHEAARLMRERAEGVRCPDGSEDVMPWREEWVNWERLDKADAAHIASWPPTVALAVADWLDRTARILPVGDNGGPAVLPGSTYEAAVAVARAYLGETP